MTSDKTITITLEHATLLKGAATLAHLYLGRNHPETTTPALTVAIDAVRAEIEASIEGRTTCYPHHSWLDPYAVGGALCRCREMVFAVYAGDVRPSTPEERMDPLSVRVIRPRCDESERPVSDPQHLCDVCDPPQELSGPFLTD